LVTHLSFKDLKMMRVHLGYSHATPENQAVEFFKGPGRLRNLAVAVLPSSYEYPVGAIYLKDSGD
jgi:hypothetical protein